MTSPLRTLVDLSQQLCLVDLIVVIDSALQLQHCSIEELRAYAERRGGRGVRLFRTALPLVDGRSESPMESLLRLVIILSGLPAPIPQAVIRDEDGFFVARGDLKAPEVAAVFEYDGAVHNDPPQHARDVARWRALRAAGYEVFPYTAADLFQAPHRIVTDYQRVLGLPVDVTAVRGWLMEWRASKWRNGRRGAQ